MQQPSVRFPVHAGASQADLPLWLTDHTWCDGVLSFADRHRKWLWLAVLFFYLAAFNGQWRIQPDAALYLSIGRSVADGKGFTYLGHPDHTAYPGWPRLIAITFKIFGSKSLVPVHLLMLGISLATVAAVYRLFLIRAGRPTAVAVSIGTGLTKAFFCYAFELWSDMPFALGVMCALAGYEGLSVNYSRPAEARRPLKLLRLDLAFLIGGLAIAAMMRPTIWPLMLAMGLASTIRAFHRRSWKWALPAILVGMTAIAGIVMAFHHGYGDAYYQYLLRRMAGHDSGVATHPLSENLQDLFSWAASDVLFQTRLGPIFNALLSLVVLSLGCGLFRYRVLWGFWFVLLLGTILISQATLDRYFLPVLPLLVYAWWDLLSEINRRLPRQWGNLAFAALLTFGSLMNLTKCCGIIAQQRQPHFLAKFDNGTYDGTPEFAKKLQDRVGEKAIILVEKPYGRVVAYLSDRNAQSAAALQANELINRPVFVVEPSKEPTRELLKSAGLEELPALFTVRPSNQHGPLATALSLHPTRPINTERRTK
jgi:hypothetical protein